MKIPRWLGLGWTVWCAATFGTGVDAATRWHVAPKGSDQNPGTESRPFQSLERARDEIRARRKSGVGAEGGFEVVIHPGQYAVRQTFQLTAEDSGSATAPVVYRAAGRESPRFFGGVRLPRFRVTTDSDLLARLPESARGKVREVTLSDVGVTDVIPFELGGFSSGRGFHTHPVVELFVDGEPMTLARWPNEGFVKTGEVPGPLTLQAWDRRPGAPEGRFHFEEDRPSRWVGEPDAWLYGYWFWDWADSYEKIENIDLARREITLAKPWHTYGYRKGQRFYAVNVLAELDSPGEWYLDRTRGRVFLWPKEDRQRLDAELSVAPFPLLTVDGASHLRFEGLTWECGASDGVRIVGGEGVRFEGCTVRRMAGTGFDVRGGRRHEFVSCDVHTLGRGGFALSGGDRKTLRPGEHLVENCHIHHLSRIDHTYTPGVWVDGVGQRLRHNLLHDIASSAMRVEGNEHLIELNEAYRVVIESDDQGAVDMFGNPTYRGNVYRHNYWHHLGNWTGSGEVGHTQRAGIRLDDAICGVTIVGNIFHRCTTGRTHFGGVQIHGGKENVVEGNLFVDCGAAVSFTPWGEKRWREFVAKAMEAPAIDRDLYLSRYPALSGLSEGHDRNSIRGNTIVRCDTVFLRLPGGTEVADNRELPKGTEFPEGPDGRLRWSEAEASRLGLAGIPFRQIGLYANAWRFQRNGEWSLRVAGPKDARSAR
ncbi:MAG: right-handed parallel beta-helix repeat-containing protein [Verrucomicrobiales bacterium]|nr:right-handed parallel beta-helix repeat-containing protein [Verrucomicrobiales bacterium]